MNKRILFVINDLKCGGSQKSLISLLESINYTLYEVDLFLFSHTGVFMKSIPKEVNILNEPKDYKYFDMPIKAAIVELIKERNFKILINRILSIFIYRTEHDRTRLEQKVWKFLRSSLPKNNDKYDMVIGYQEKNPIYYIVEKTNANVKVGWIHTDYSQININHIIEEKYFNKLDNIVTVSDKLVEILSNKYKSNRNKIQCIENIISPESIKALADNEPDIEFNNEYISIVSMGRIVDAKGYDISIRSCNELINRGKRIKWYIIGEGGMKESLMQLVKQLGIDKDFIFIGAKENPYPYIKMADIYVQTSKFEGKSIAVEEAKILYKPIVITDFSSAVNQIKNNYNGIITAKDYKSVASSIEKIIENKELKQRFINNLSKEISGNIQEVNKLYRMIN